MKLFAVILTICVLRACRCNSTSEASTEDKIYSGKYPSHVVIKLASRDVLVCEGVLIANNYVLTAAGCVHKYKSSPKALEVVAGVISTENIQSDKNAQIRQVSNLTIHQEWFTSKQKSADIAVLKVSPSFNTNKYVNVSAYAAELFTNDTVRIVGYGDSENLISNKLKVPPKNECYYGGGSSSNNTDKFCVKFNGDGDEEIFWQKSFAGAPILLEDADKDVSGLMSVNHNSITYVKHYADWIGSTSGVSRTKNRRVQPTQSTPSSSSNQTSNATNSPNVWNSTTSSTPSETTTVSTDPRSTTFSATRNGALY